LVVCSLNPPSDTFQEAPVVILEVISESTRRTDEYEKREAYLSIGTLCVYILAEQATAAAVVYRRTDSGFARESYVGLDAVIPLPEIDCELPLADLYEGVEFPPPRSDEEDEFDE
jgi:Uma2 family endonuclease